MCPVRIASDRYIALAKLWKMEKETEELRAYIREYFNVYELDRKLHTARNEFVRKNTDFDSESSGRIVRQARA